jgi:hypothetical protein
MWGYRMLTDMSVKKSKPRETAFKLADSGGLYLFVTPAGGKFWRLKYRIGGKEKLLSIGPFPRISLAEARVAREAAKKALADHRDPGLMKHQRRLTAITESETTFESIARRWHSLQLASWTEKHGQDVLGSLERDVFADLGSLPLKEITPPMVLSTLRKIEARPAIETARRVRQRISEVFVFAIASGIAENDPAAIVRKAMAHQVKGRLPAVTTLGEAREILRKVDASPANPVTKLALRLLALTVLRPGCLISTPWIEFRDLDPREPIWRIPAARMKLHKHQKRTKPEIFGRHSQRRQWKRSQYCILSQSARHLYSRMFATRTSR